jgi:aminopeptidase N
LIGSFCANNLVQFHALNGSGYEFLTEQVLVLDQLNPQIAARLLLPLTQWRRYDDQRQNLQRSQLERIVKTAGISKDVYEIASKSL